MKHIRLENVLAEMQRWVPWQNLVVLIKPHYLKSWQNGRQAAFSSGHYAANPPDAAIHSLSDPTMEETLIEIPNMRRSLVWT